MSTSKTFRRTRVVHASTHDGRPVCTTRPGPFIRLTQRHDRVTCPDCLGHPQLVHYAPAGPAVCRASSPRLCTTPDAALTTCQNCLRTMGLRIIVRNTGQNYGRKFPQVVRHYGELTAPCGTSEAGFARTMEWELVDCSACLAVKNEELRIMNDEVKRKDSFIRHSQFAIHNSAFEAQTVLLRGCIQSSWDFAVWPHQKNGKLRMENGQ